MSKLKVPVGAADHIQGNAEAGCTLVEYGDYECPHCGHAYSIVKRLQKHFGERLRFVYRNFPLTELHPNAEASAESTEFAGAHDKFWPMHDLLFENQQRLGVPLFEELAGKLKLDAADLLKALQSGEFTARVKADFAGGVRSGVNGTPTFFMNGERYDGVPEYPAMVEVIASVLSSAQR